MRSSSAGAEMLADKEKTAENTLCVFSRALTQYEGISARQNRVCPCQSTQVSFLTKQTSTTFCREASEAGGPSSEHGGAAVCPDDHAASPVPAVGAAEPFPAGRLPFAVSGRRDDAAPAPGLPRPSAPALQRTGVVPKSADVFRIDIAHGAQRRRRLPAPRSVCGINE